MQLGARGFGNWHVASLSHFRGIKSSFVPYLFICVFFLQHERKTSIVVPASSQGLLWALGQTKMRAQPAVPKGMEKILRAGSELSFHQPHCRREGEGKMEQREQW